MRHVSFPGYWARSLTRIIPHKLSETDEVRRSKETILLKGNSATQPSRLFLSLTQGHSTYTVQDPNMTLKMGCKAPYHTPHPPSLKADIKYLCWTIYRFSPHALTAQVPADWRPVTTIHPTKRSAVVTFPTQNPDHPLVFNDAVCILLLSQVAKSTFNRTIWNTVPTYLQKLTGWLVTTSHPGLSTTAKLHTGNLKSRILSYNLEFQVIDFINTGEVAQQLYAKWNRSSPTCLSPQPHSSHCTSSIQPTPSSDSSMEQWHFGKGH